VTAEFLLHYHMHIYEYINSNTVVMQSFFQTTRRKSSSCRAFNKKSTRISALQSSCHESVIYNCIFCILDDAYLKMCVAALSRKHSFANARNSDPTGEASHRFAIKPAVPSLPLRTDVFVQLKKEGNPVPRTPDKGGHANQHVTCPNLDRKLPSEI
jgi:hypothetical protein